MSLFGSIGKAVKGVVSNPIGKKLLGAIPGVGTAIAIGSMGYDLINAGKPKQSTFPSLPSTPGTFPSLPAGPISSVAPQVASYDLGFIQGRIKANNGNVGQAIQWRDAINSGQISLDEAEAMNWQAGGGAMGTMGMMQAGAVPGWGSLAQRAAPIVARAARKWVPRVLASGATVWALVDAAGNVLKVQSNKPHRRMNVLNPRALGRAHRRMDGFRNYAAKAMRHYGYTVSRTAKPKSKKRRKH